MSGPEEATKENPSGPWWGEVGLEIGEAVAWEIGPLRLWLHRGSAEWRLGHQWDDGDERLGWSMTRAARLPEEGPEMERFAVDATRPQVRLEPRPADRPVVVRPRTPLRVLPGHQARVFVSSPLWVEIAVDPGPIPLRELPCKRLSDTWFGATTREGEFCYAVKTNARTEVEELPRSAYRLLTPIVIANRGVDALLVERISLPVPFLSLFSTADHAVWSEEVHMHRTEGGDMAELDVHPGPPAEAAGARRLAGPRLVAEKGHLFRAFGSLILGFD